MIISLVQSSIVLLGIQINEPVTTLTDLIVAVICLYAYLKLRKIPATQKSHNYYLYFFFVMAIASAMGGLIGHGFIYLFNKYWVYPGWGASIIGINLLTKALIHDSRIFLKQKVWKAIYLINIIELPVLLFMLSFYMKFMLVILYSVYGLVLITGIFSSLLYFNSSVKGYGFFMLSAAFTTVTIIIFVNELNIHPWFNQADMGHVLLAVNSYFLYTGTEKIFSSQPVPCI